MKLLATTAITLTFAAGNVLADNHDSQDAGMTMSSSADMAAMEGQLIRTRDITGGTVYTMNEASDEGWSVDMMHQGVGSNWNQIGEIEDIVLSQDGKMIGIVAEVGGFLDIGDKHVVIAVGDMNLVAVDDQTYAFVTRLNEEDLEGLPAIDEGYWN